MSNSVIILGAGGRFGRAATHAFIKRDWQVSILTKPDSAGEQLNETSSVSGDVYDIHSLTRAINGHDVVINALNPPYSDWERDVPRLTRNVIEASLSCSATVMVPGNVYNYGVQMPNRLLESTKHLASTKKGKIRTQMEREYKSAVKKGLRTIILRGGDFIEQKKTGNWFDTYIINRVKQGIFTYPGSLDCMHAWAFLPDMAQAMVLLAEKRTELNAFDEFGFESFNITGQELMTEVEMTLGKTLKLKTVPWPMMKLILFFSPTVKEVLEMRYLWDVPHHIDGTKLKKQLPEFRPTRLKSALKDLL